MLVSLPALLGVPLNADSNEIVIELNSADTLWPRPSVVYYISVFDAEQMHRFGCSP